MGRALSWSLAAHAAFIISFLLLSATRQPLMLPQIARPVRLVTYLEPPPAPRQRTSVPALSEAARAPVVPVEPRVVQPAAPTPAVPPLPAAAPILVPRVAIPVREQAPAPTRTPPPAGVPAPGVRPTLRERLERQLASATPAASRPVDIPPPHIAGLQPSESVAPAPGPDRTVPAAALQPGAVTPIGYFPHDWYLALLKKNVFDRWLPPPDVFKTSRSPTALVSFRIDRAGRIGAIALKEGSGSARFDTSALAAVQGLGRVPTLPEQYPEESLDVVIRFQNQK